MGALIYIIGAIVFIFLFVGLIRKNCNSAAEKYLTKLDVIINDVRITGKTSKLIDYTVITRGGLIYDFFCIGKSDNGGWFVFLFPACSSHKSF